MIYLFLTETNEKNQLRKNLNHTKLYMMSNIRVQTRLMPDVVKTTSNHIPGIFYNLLVSSTDSNGNHIPSSVRFRALKTLNDPAHSEIGTSWSEPIKTSIFGHVLWSINALTDAQPPTIEVEVTQLIMKVKPSNQ